MFVLIQHSPLNQLFLYQLVLTFYSPKYPLISLIRTACLTWNGHLLSQCPQAIQSDAFFLKIHIVVFCKRVPGHSQVVIFIDKTYIESRRTRLAMITINAYPLGVLRRERTQDRIVLFLVRRLKESENTLDIVYVARSGQYGQNARLIEGVCVYTDTRSAPA